MEKTAELKNKRIVITGASMGIGKAVAIALASKGASLVINSSGGGKNNTQALSDIVSEITSNRGTASYSCGSVADYDYAGELIQQCVDNYGGIDGLINIAGIAEPTGSSILNIAASDWQQVINVHLNGTFNTCRHAAPLMAAQKHGNIINTGSHAFQGSYGGTAYAAAKGAINSLSTAIAKDLTEDNVRCNVLMPGAKTRLSSGEAFEKNMRTLHSRGMLDTQRLESALTALPAEFICAAYEYLMSDAAADISGQLLSISGRHLGSFAWPQENIMAYIDASDAKPWRLETIAEHYQNFAD